MNRSKIAAMTAVHFKIKFKVNGFIRVCTGKEEQGGDVGIGGDIDRQVLLHLVLPSEWRSPSFPLGHFRPFEQHDQASVAADFLFAGLCLCLRTTHTAHHYIFCGIRSCQCLRITITTTFLRHDKQDNNKSHRTFRLAVAQPLSDELNLFIMYI
ncbi:uncharacterized protein LOC128922121 [Zeugodacus cucurbitae]|uniref:uncharacterized protein LOC128922121 n=1 Tax=Zeugodacus cucurbitae TaxID=28588 RepID=UPI0023D8ED91|nr:uncharacterized protein LOC128922121 [Zeugodacus cucurbitae]